MSDATQCNGEHGSPETEDAVDRRDFLTLALGLTVGSGPGDQLLAPVDPVRTPAPIRVGEGEIAQLRTVTDTLSALDRRHGARAVRDAVLAQLRWAEGLLASDVRPATAPTLHGALADLRSLAGWTSHDVGMNTPAKDYLLAALGSARLAGDPLRIVSVLHRLGCVHLSEGAPDIALRFFQLGHLSASEAGSGSAAALLHGHEAKAYADLQQPRQALSSLHRAESTFEAGSGAPALHDLGIPLVAPLLDRGGLDNLAGRVLSTLSLRDSTLLDDALDRLHRSAVSDRGARERRRTLTLNRMAVTCLQHDAIVDGARFGEQAVESTDSVRSQRVVDKFTQLRAAAQRHRAHPDARALVDHIGTLALVA